MLVCIHAKLLGDSRHLISDTETGTFTATDEIPTQAWVLGDDTSILSINDLALATKVPIDTTPPERYVRQIQQVGLDANTPPWSKIMPRAVFRDYIQRLLRDAEGILGGGQAETHGPVMEKSRRVFRSIVRASVDGRMVEDLLRSGSLPLSQAELLKSFRPDDTGFAELVTYSRSASTGRTTVSSGPMILGLRKDLRSVVRSSYAGGRVVQFDFASLEPRILFGMTGQQCPDDIYEHASKNILNGEVTRNDSKIIIMGILFGIGLTRLTEITGGKFDVVEAIFKIRDAFGLEGLEERLKREFKSNDHITSLSGRVIIPKRTDPSGLVSYFTQSSGEDVVLEGFSSIVTHFEECGLKVRPIFLIHDAMSLDVHPEVTDEDLGKAIVKGQTVSQLPVKFLIKQKAFQE